MSELDSKLRPPMPSPGDKARASLKQLKLRMGWCFGAEGKQTVTVFSMGTAELWSLIPGAGSGDSAMYELEGETYERKEEVEVGRPGHILRNHRGD